MPRVSILTPTWNRSGYIKRVWEGLVSQSYRNFEWIVANDGSADDTAQIIRDLAAQSDFPITLINASIRIGKSRMDNEAVRCARGEFILWCDSDDFLLPNALETLLNTWESIPESEKGDFAGITALCESQEGILDNVYPQESHTDVIWNELLSKMKFDFVLFARSDLLKKNPFLEVDFLIPETTVWNILGLKKTRFIPTPLKCIEYKSANCISYSGLMEYNRGRAYAMALSRKNLAYKRHGSWQLITFLRYCIHGDISVLEVINMWREAGGNAALLLFFYPAACLLAMKDEFQSKVRKTHLQYLQAAKFVKISVEELKMKASA